MEEVFKFLGGKIVSHPSSKRQSSPELYLEWQFPEPYTKYNHPTWKNLHLEDDWNFLHILYQKKQEELKEDGYSWNEGEIWSLVEESLILNNKIAFLHNFKKIINQQTK